MKKSSPLVEPSIAKLELIPKNIKYGFDLDQYKIVKKKIKNGDTFGSILEENSIDYPEVYKILKVVKNKVNVKRLVVGNYYTLLFTKDSILTPKPLFTSRRLIIIQLFNYVTVFMVKKWLNQSKSLPKKEMV